MDLTSSQPAGTKREAGAALGLGGPAFTAAWFGDDTTYDAVPAATGRGLLHAVLWCVGFASILVVGRLAVPALGAGWALIALLVMLLVARLWSSKFGIRRPHP